jgi:AcrR family transcriptional regulator
VPSKRVSSSENSADTKQLLIDGTFSALRSHGIAGVSARTIAAAAGVNQALVFYHFGSVYDLVSQACYVSTEARINLYRPQIEAATSVTELISVGRIIHNSEYEAGNVTVLAQVLAGAQQHPELAEAARNSLQLWIDALYSVAAPLIERSPLNGLVDVVALTEMAAAAFIGMELWDGIKPSHSADPFAALQPLAAAADLIDALGPVSKKAIRSQLSRVIRKQQATKKTQR